LEGRESAIVALPVYKKVYERPERAGLQTGDEINAWQI
jgi:hypothetical protein